MKIYKYGWQAIGYRSYFEYIRSDTFKEKKEILFNHRGKICEKCGCGEYEERDVEVLKWGKYRTVTKICKTVFNVHHLNYYNVCNEGFDDLQILCADCHEEISKQVTP